MIVDNLAFSEKEEPLIVTPKYLWFLILCYTMVFFASNWFDPRQIKLFGLTTGAGSIVFPLTYLFSDIITEVYGYKKSRIAVWSSLLFLSAFSILWTIYCLLSLRTFHR